MREYLHDVQDDPVVKTPAQDYSIIHAKLVTQHAYLTTALSSFNASYGDSLQAAIAAVEGLNQTPQINGFGSL